MKKTKIPKTNTYGIKPTKLKSQGISFSFKYYRDAHNKFSCNNKAAKYWLTLLDRLRTLSALSAKELMVNRGNALRCHPIKWEDTSENGFGLPNEEQLADTPCQFSLSSNKHGRVHGFLIDEIFYIVWLDPDHVLYSAKA